MTPLGWAAVLMLIGFGFVFLEMFLPSGGLLGVLSASSIICSIFLAYYFGGMATGTGFLLFAVASLPIVLGSFVRWWPHTPLGRLIMIQPPEGDDEILPESLSQRHRQALLGKRGVAKSSLLPAGAVSIAGVTYDAVSDGVAIDAGQPVVVIEVHGNHMVVRLDEPSDEPDHTAAMDRDDILSQSIESLGLEELDEPLG